MKASSPFSSFILFPAGTWTPSHSRVSSTRSMGKYLPCQTHNCTASERPAPHVGAQDSREEVAVAFSAFVRYNASMKPRHAAALALVGWYLMLPPNKND